MAGSRLIQPPNRCRRIRDLRNGKSNDSIEAVAGVHSAREAQYDNFLRHGRRRHDSWQGGGVIIFGLGGSDLLFGNEGYDIIYGNSGNDTIYGDSDTPSGGGTPDPLDGGDSIGGGEGDDVIQVWNGFNRVDGNAGNDSILGGTERDVINGGAGADTIRAGAGNDVIYVADNDVIDGGAGRDFIRFYGYGISPEVFGVRLDLNVVTAQLARNAGTLTVSGVEDIFGSLIGDWFAGTSGPNYIDGFSGRDVIFGRGGNDWLRGGYGNDLLTGGAGRDTFAFYDTLNVNYNVDTVADFNSADDTLWLDDLYFGFLPKGTLAAEAFVTGRAALEADDRIIYDQTRGLLFFDSDGNGGAGKILFASLGAGTVVVLEDFLVG